MRGEKRLEGTGIKVATWGLKVIVSSGESGTGKRGQGAWEVEKRTDRVWWAPVLEAQERKGLGTRWPLWQHQGSWDKLFLSARLLYHLPPKGNGAVKIRSQVRTHV